MKKMTNKDKKFIIDLSKRINTQDTRCTAKPYGLILLEEKTRVVPEDCGDRTVAYWKENEYHTVQELQDDIKEYYSDLDEMDIMHDHVQDILETTSFHYINDYAADELGINICVCEFGSGGWLGFMAYQPLLDI